MENEASEPLDDDFTTWAVHCDEAIFTGRHEHSASESVTLSSRPRRRERFQACLLRLEQDRRTQLSKGGETSNRQSSEAWSLPQLPKELGRFRIVEVLGAGGFGVVYLAMDPRLGRHVALKVPRPEALLSWESRQRFIREAQTTARLNHPYILPVFESGEVGPFCFLVSAYCAGGSLAGWLSHQKQLVHPRTAAELLHALASAIQYAHDCNVLHRDLKPANVLLEPLDGQTREPWSDLGFVPRIGDFGLAKLLDPDHESADAAEAQSASVSAARSSLTRTQAFLGTPAYMAPEQAESRRAAIGPATDVYALGVILYEVLAGHPPFQGASSLDTLRRVAEQEPVAPRRARPEIPADLEAICLKCLEKQPQRRYAGAGALAEDLHRFLDGRPTLARPVGWRGNVFKWCRRKPAVAGLLATAGVAIAVVAVSVLFQVWQSRAHLEAFAKLAEREHRQAAAAAVNELRAQQAAEISRNETYGRRISELADLFQQAHPQSLRPILNTLRPLPGQQDLRGFEWRYLWEQGHPRALGPQVGVVPTLAFAADGRQLLTTTDGRSVVQWNAITAQIDKHLESESLTPAFGWGIAMSKGAGRIAYSAADENNERRAIHVWDTRSGREIVHQKVATAHPYHLAISADGNTVAYAGQEKTGTPVEVNILHADTGALTSLRPAASVYVRCLSISPDGRLLAIGLEHVPCTMGQHDFLVELWDIETGKLRHTLKGHLHFILAVAFSPDGRYLASGSADLGVWLWDVHSGEKVRRLSADGIATQLAFSPDGARLAVCAGPPPQLTSNSRLSLWDVATATQLPHALEPGYQIIALAFAPDGKSIAVSGANRSLLLWKAEEVRRFVDLPGPPGGEAWTVAFSPDSRAIAAGYDDEAGQHGMTLAVWNPGSRRLWKRLKGHRTLVYGVTYSPDGKTIASSGFDKSVRLWDASTGELRHTLTGHREKVRSVAYLPDGSALVSASRDGTIRVWDATTGVQRLEIAAPGSSVHSVVVASDGQSLIAAVESSVCIWDLPSGKLRQTFKVSNYVAALAISQDGTRLAAGNESGEIAMWDFSSGAKIASLQGHLPGKRGAVLGLAFSPDGRTLASAGEDKTLRLWQASTSAELLCFKDLPAAVNGVAFSPDGAWLAAALHNGLVRLWAAPRQIEEL